MQVTDFFIDNSVITIKNGVQTIQSGILPINHVTCIKMPGSVQKIYPKTISCDVIYDGIFVSKNEIDQYGCQQIPRLAIFKKYQLDYNKMERETFLLLPLTNDALKGYKANHLYYRKLRQKVQCKIGTEDYFFKICYSLGFFMVPPKTRLEVEKAVSYIYDYGKFSNFVPFQNFDVKTVDMTFIQFVLGLYRNDQLFEFMPYYVKMYNDCKQICKIIKKRKVQMMYDLNKEKQEMEQQGQDVTYIKKQLEVMNENSKCVTFGDVKDYFTNYTFEIREGNEALKAILPLAQQHIYSQRSFDILQDIYEEAKKVKVTSPSIFTPLKGQYQDFTYRWLEGDDYENLVLGYLVNCCAKLHHTGEDIMRFSMINPQVKTLVVYDSLKTIIGKSTAFYSLEGKYLLGNNIEVAHSFILSSKTTEQQKQALLQTFLKGLQAQASAMNKIGYMVNEIRVGMLRNNLADQLQQYPIEKEQLLPNIQYGSYMGDASNHEAGQAILDVEREVTK